MSLCPWPGHTHCRDGGDRGGGPEWDPHQGRRTTGDDPQGWHVTIGFLVAGWWGKVLFSFVEGIAVILMTTFKKFLYS